MVSKRKVLVSSDLHLSVFCNYLFLVTWFCACIDPDAAVSCLQVLPLNINGFAMVTNRLLVDCLQ